MKTIIVTGYALEADVERLKFDLKLAEAQGNVYQSLSLTKRIVDSEWACARYDMISRVVVRWDNEPSTITLREAKSTERVLTEVVRNLGNRILSQIGFGDPIAQEKVRNDHSKLSARLASIKAAIAEGMANKLDIQEHDIVTDEG